MGMGVAGSYLMARLKDSEHEVVGYERMIQEKHDSICAWGTIKEELTNFCKKTGRDFNNFLIHDGKNMHVKMNNDVKFDKIPKSKIKLLKKWKPDRFLEKKIVNKFINENN